jgi:DNA mismatch endonuclease, patch repair protein
MGDRPAGRPIARKRFGRTRIITPPTQRVFDTTPVRSRLMSRVRSRNNKSTELRLLAIMRKHNLRGWRRHLPLPGSPDFVFRSAKLVIFVDGCFWHGCPRCYKAPRSNAAFWAKKVAYNRTRDLRISRELRSQGWAVLRMWEHSLRAESRVASRILRAVTRPRIEGEVHQI